MELLLQHIKCVNPKVVLSAVVLHDNNSLNNLFLAYGTDGLLEYINEQRGDQNITELPINGLQVISEQKILFEGKTAMFEVRGYLPADNGKMEIALFVINPETNYISRQRIDLYYGKRVKELCKDECENQGYNINLFTSDVSQLITLLVNHRDGLTSTQSNKVKIDIKKELTPSAEKKA